jgi:iron(III) transport system substrate-binding protein
MIRKFVSMGFLSAALAWSGVGYAEKGSAGTGEQGKASKEWNELIEAAKKEGGVNVILSGQVPQKLRGVMPEFEKKYGVKVNFQTGSGRKHAERILAERRMGRYTADVWMGGANTPLVRLIPNGALRTVPELIVDPQVKDTSKWYKGEHHYTDPEHRYIFTWGASPSHVIAINTDMVKPEEIKSYQDLLDPKWKGKMVSMSPARTGSGATVVPMVLNPKIGEEWFQRLINEQDVTFVEDARQGAEWIAMGRFPVGLFGMSSPADEMQEQGFPIQGYLEHPMKEGEVLSASAANIMVLDKAPNPKAAQLFLNWALSQDAQLKFVNAAERMDSLRTDVSNEGVKPPYRIQRNGDYLVAFTNPQYIEKQDEVLKKIKKMMSDAGYQ